MSDEKEPESPSPAASSNAKLAAQVALLQRKLEASSALSEERYEKFVDLRDRYRELNAVVHERNAIVAELRSRNGSLNIARRESWLSHFVMISGAFAEKVIEQSGDIPAPNVIVAHEDLALRAMLRLNAEHHDTRVIFDNVEYPDHRGRIRFSGSMQERNDDASNAAVLAFKSSAINTADLVFASSAGQADALSELGVATPTQVLYNCRSKEAQISRSGSQIRLDCGVSEDQQLILYLNNAYEGGGSEETIEMLHHLDDSVHVAFLGSAKLGDVELSAVAKSQGLGERCSFLDLVPSSYLVEYISGADLVTIPLQPGLANFETCMPNRVFEAIAARVPIVSHRDIAIGAFISEHGLGAVFPEVTAQAMAAAVEELLNRDMSAALILAADRFVWEVEERKLLAEIPSETKTIYLLANKGIERNNRIFRITRSLARTAELHVFARSAPADDLLVAGVTYHQIGGLL